MPPCARRPSEMVCKPINCCGVEDITPVFCDEGQIHVHPEMTRRPHLTVCMSVSGQTGPGMALAFRCRVEAKSAERPGASRPSRLGYRLWNSRPLEGEIECVRFAAGACGRRHAAAGTCTSPDGRPQEASTVKIERARKRHLDETSTALARQNLLIVVGNVKAAGPGRTRMAKSVSESTLRQPLRSKALHQGASHVEGDGRWSSQTCSDCGAISDVEGIAGLGAGDRACSAVRGAAPLILAARRNVALQQTEIPAHQGGEDVCDYDASLRDETYRWIQGRSHRRPPLR